MYHNYIHAKADKMNVIMIIELKYRYGFTTENIYIIYIYNCSVLQYTYICTIYFKLSHDCHNKRKIECDKISTDSYAPVVGWPTENIKNCENMKNCSNSNAVEFRSYIKIYFAVMYMCTMTILFLITLSLDVTTGKWNVIMIIKLQIPYVG